MFKKYTYLRSSLDVYENETNDICTIFLFLIFGALYTRVNYLETSKYLKSESFHKKYLKLKDNIP